MITNMSALSLLDGQTTPVAHAYVPASRVAENVARWRDQEHNSGLPIGFSIVTFSVKDPTAPGGVYRVKTTLSIPKIDLTVPASPKLVGVARVSTEYIFPDSFSSQERKDVIAQNNQLWKVGYGTTIGDNAVELSLPY